MTLDPILLSGLGFEYMHEEHDPEKEDKETQEIPATPQDEVTIGDDGIPVFKNRPTSAQLIDQINRTQGRQLHQSGARLLRGK